MSLFTASSGVELDEYGRVNSRPPGCGYEEYHEARKEFYQNLRDKELGRWRDPEAPNFVVYTSTNPNRITVTDEITGHSELYFRDRTDTSDYGDTAKRYFEAHPEPKPWHDAKPGEIWVLEFGGGKSAYTRTPTLFTKWNLPSLLPTDTGIKSGRRIWPEGAK